MKRKIWLSGICVVSLGLAACATIPAKISSSPSSVSSSVEAKPKPAIATSSPTATASWRDQQMRLAALKSWQLNGKIAVQTAQDSGSASVNWTQHLSHYDMSLMGPFGAKSINLQGHPGAVVLKTGDGQRFTATSPEGLLAKQWGWNLPVSNLAYWIRGIPVPGISYDTRFDTNNRLSILSQAGWTIQYLDYTTIGSLTLPNRLYISSPSLKTKIIIYHWQV